MQCNAMQCNARSRCDAQRFHWKLPETCEAAQGRPQRGGASVVNYAWSARGLHVQVRVERRHAPRR
jgi:hypothetical protein